MSTHNHIIRSQKQDDIQRYYLYLFLYIIKLGIHAREFLGCISKRSWLIWLLFGVRRKGGRGLFLWPSVVIRDANGQGGSAHSLAPMSREENLGSWVGPLEI